MTTPATMKLVSNLSLTRWWFEVGGARVALDVAGVPLELPEQLEPVRAAPADYCTRDEAVTDAALFGLAVDDAGDCSVEPAAPAREVDTRNDFLLGARVTDAGNVVHVRRGIAPGAIIPKAQALRLAAWLVVLVDPEREAFNDTLAAVESA
jgi:hypothetical protein